MEINIKESRKAKLTFDDLEPGDFFAFKLTNNEHILRMKTAGDSQYCDTNSYNVIIGSLNGNKNACVGFVHYATTPSLRNYNKAEVTKYEVELSLIEV